MSTYPPAFESLERFAAWALPMESARNGKRTMSTTDELVELFETVDGAIEDIARHLDAMEFSDYDVADERLLWLAFSYIEAGIAVERYKAPTVVTGFDTSRLVMEEADRGRPTVRS